MPKDELRDKILAKIRAHEVTMRPRLYFSAQLVGLMLGTAALIFVSVFILNFILFSIRIELTEGTPAIGVTQFLQFFPWHLLVLAVVLFGAVLWLLRQFKFVYRVPLLYLLGALLSATIITAAIVDRATPINDQLLLRADRHQLPPPFGDIYRGVHHARPYEVIIITQ